MGALEKIVRPFQSPDQAAAARRVPVDQQAPAARIKIQAGRGTGTGKTLSTSSSHHVSYYCEAAQNEAHFGEGVS